MARSPIMRKRDIAGAVADALRAANYRENLPKFNSLGDWGTHFFPHYCKLPAGKHHKELSIELWDLTIRRGLRRAYQAPRGYAKSTYISFFLPIHNAVERFDDYILLCADTSKQAVKYLKAIRHELETNEELAKAYPNACGEGLEWNDESLLLRNGVRIEALSTGQKMRGRKQYSERPSLIIGDDLQGDEALYSEAQRTHDWEWLERGLLPAGSRRTDTNIVLAGTNIHLDCIINRIIADKEASVGWTGKIYRAVEYPRNMELWSQWKNILCNLADAEREAKARSFYNERKDAMDEGAEVLWEQYEDLYELMTQWARNQSSFESEKRNNPIDPSKCEWPPDLFEGVGFTDWPPPQTVKFKAMGVDPSRGSKNKPGDYCAIIMMMVDERGLLYVDADLERRFIEGPGGVIDRVVQLAAYFGPDVIGVEGDQFQEVIGTRIKEEALKRGMPPLPLVPIPTEGVPKPIRIRRLGPYIGMRAVRFKENSGGVLELIRQFKMFTGAPDGVDDGPDAMEMALRAITEYVAYVDSEAERKRTEGGVSL